MPSQGQTIDHSLEMGANADGPGHFQRFIAWAKIHRQTTIGLQLVSLLKSGLDEELLGGMLQFLSYRQTAQVLKSWGFERPRLQPLASIALHLGLHFPDLARARTSPAIGDQFPKQVTSNYLACQFSTRQAPRLPTATQLRLTCFRIWILQKALEYAAQGNTFDLSLQQVCKYTRMALDTQGDSRKLDFLIDLLQPSSDLADFELTLGEAVKLRRASEQNSASNEFLRAIHSLLNGQHKPIASSSAAPALSLTAELWAEKWGLEDNLSIQKTTATPDGSQVSAFVTDDGELIETDVDENASVSEVVRESRGIAFLSREDLHYLPFSWNRLRSDERLALNSAVQIALVSASDKNQLIAGIAAIAVSCRHSMETIRSMPIRTETLEGWALNPETLQLHRRASRKKTRWTARGAALQWVKSLCDVWNLQLHDHLRSVLGRAIKSFPNARTLGELWPIGEQSLESAFNDWCHKQPGLGRVTSGMLARTLEQNTYELTHDHVFAQLISNPNGTGIPGAGAYPSWPQSMIAKTLNAANRSLGTMTMAMATDSNAMGSELDPDDRMLASALHRAFLKLQTLAQDGSSWIEFHNHLTAYTVAVLLAATGARPVDSVFESSKQFNLRSGLAYIEDKVVSMGAAGGAGRLVPLPESVVLFLRNHYLPNLLRLANAIKPYESEFACEVEAQARGHGSTKLPLFFFLRSVPDFQWYSVTESTFDALTIVDWPLPLNLFRHRLAVRLRTLHLDPELIDAQLGHAESGAETHGDASFRCWSDDLPDWRKSIEAAFELLRLELPSVSGQEIAISEVRRVYELFPDQGVFGQKARSEKRIARKDAAAQGANDEISAFVGKRSIDSISPAEWEKLGRQMILTDGNLRQANALTRYKVFESYLQNCSNSGNARPRLKKWVTALPIPRSAFVPGSVDVLERLERSRQVLDAAFSVLKTPSMMAIADAVVLITVELALNARIADLEVLSAVAAPRDGHVQLVVFKKRLYLEHSVALADADCPAVKRFLVPTRAAKYLELILGAKKTIESNSKLPDYVLDVLKCIDPMLISIPNLDAVRRQLAGSVDLENAILLPGAVAGVLAGRVKSYALNHSDWLRVMTGKSYVPPGPETILAATEASLEMEPPVHIPRGRKAGDINADERITINAAFIRKLRDAVTAYTAPKIANSSVPDTADIRRGKTLTNTETASRAATRSNIAVLIKNSEPSISAANIALAEWVIYLLKRPYRKKLLDGVSVYRYLCALTSGFRSFGYDVDLADLDADELTEFYSQVIDPPVSNDLNEDNTGSEEGSIGPSKKKLSGQYTFERLRDFHTFARSRFGLEEPDWSDLGDGLLGSIARPGFISEPEYLHALGALCAKPSTQNISKVRDAFILLLTFRFGLRGGEAISLPRNNWISVNAGGDDNGTGNSKNNVVVIVNGQFKKLKTQRSARQIPLLEDLTRLERKVVETWLIYWEAETSGNVGVPLFFAHREKGGVADIRNIRDRLINCLRRSTGAAHINLHHARHSFGNRVGIPLFLKGTSNVWAGCKLNTAALVCHFRSTVLSTTHVTRRAPWALARLLGHVNSSTTINSYLHFLFDLSAELIASNDRRSLFKQLTGKPLNRAIYLDTWPIRDEYLTVPKVADDQDQYDHSPSKILEYFRLRAHGLTPSAAANHCLVNPDFYPLIETSLISAGASLSGQQQPYSQVSEMVLPIGLLGHIQEHRWGPLIEWAKTHPKPYETGAQQFENFGLQVGTNRQILLWKKEQCLEMKAFLDWAGWSKLDIHLYAQKNLGIRMKNCLEMASLGEARPTAVAHPISSEKRKASETKKLFQVDRVRVPDGFDSTDVIYPDRVAVVRSPEQSIIQDNYEMILLWLAFSLGQPQHDVSPPAATPKGAEQPASPPNQVGPRDHKSLF